MTAIQERQYGYSAPHRPELSLVENHTETGHSLDDTYPILNEVDCLRSQGIEDESSQRSFFSEEMRHFLYEHAGYAKVTTIDNFRLTDDAFTYEIEDSETGEISAIDMKKAWARTVGKFGFGSREHNEVVGYQQAVKALRNGADAAVISSPQKSQYMDRRFTFILTKGSVYGGDPNVVTQTNILHTGADKTMLAALQDYADISHLSSVVGIPSELPETEGDMLRSPIALATQTPSDLERMYSILGVGAQERAESNNYMNQVNLQLGEEIRIFEDIMIQLVRVYDGTNTHDGEVQRLVSDAQKLRDYIFKGAEVVREDITGAASRNDLTDFRELIEGQYDSVLERARYVISSTPEARVYGGLTCPADRQRTSGLDNLMPEPLGQALAGGATMSQILNELTSDEKSGDKEHMRCPLCEKTVRIKIENGMVYCQSGPKAADGKSEHRVSAKAVCAE